MNKITFLNCFCDLTESQKYKIPKQKFSNVYLKIKLAKLKKLNLDINTNNITVEITNIDFNYFDYEMLSNICIKKNLKMIILNYEIFSENDLNIENKSFEIIKQLQKLNFDNLGVDFYLGNTVPSFKKTLKVFLQKYKNIKHFSVYFVDDDYLGTKLKNNFLSYKRYHLHMWSLQEKYQSSYSFAIVKDKEYLGIGEDAVSRKKNNFYEFLKTKSSWNIKKMENISEEFIEFNDHMSRLEFYKKIGENEWKVYKQISKEKYQKLLVENKNDLVIVHDLLIHELILNNLDI